MGVPGATMIMICITLSHFYMECNYPVVKHFFTVLTGWETQNKYRVRNTLGQQVYFASESKLTL